MLGDGTSTVRPVSPWRSPAHRLTGSRIVGAQQCADVSLQRPLARPSRRLYTALVNALPEVTAVVLHFGAAAVTERSLASLAASVYPRLDVVIVNNAPAAPWRVAGLPTPTVLAPTTNTGYAGGNNLALRALARTRRLRAAAQQRRRARARRHRGPGGVRRGRSAHRVRRRAGRRGPAARRSTTDG